MKVKTSELSGSALDLMVAICEGEEFYPTTDPDRYNVEKGVTHNFNPSVDWAQGGPIIEREGISVLLQHDTSSWLFLKDCSKESGNVEYYRAVCGGAIYEEAYDFTSFNKYKDAYGNTPLIAAMRCYVVSKLGVEVEVPNELINK